MKNSYKIIHIESCDFLSFPLGGSLSFAKQFLNQSNQDLYLVGIGSKDDVIGKWCLKEINNKKVQYFPFCSIDKVKKTRFPKRLYTYIKLKKHLKKISVVEHDIILTQTPQFVFLISKYKWSKFCFYFAGLGNSIGLSRFKHLRFLGAYYEKKLFKTLDKNCDIILAAADKESILSKARQYNLEDDRIKFFPTRYDDEVFYVADRKFLRKKLNYSEELKIIVTTGRLSYIKGWQLIIDSYRLLNSTMDNLILIFIGEGEDRVKIENYAKKEIGEGTIQLKGRLEHVALSEYLNIADTFVMGSLIEGFPTSMVEALACGKNIVSTNVSGAKDMISEGVNGYVINDRNKEQMAEALKKVLNFDTPNKISLTKAKQYKSSFLNKEFLNICFNKID